MRRVERQDALAFVSSLADASVACAILDPPHQGLDKHRAVGTTTRLAKRWFPTIPDADIVSCIRVLYGKLRKDAYCWVFCDARLEWALVSALTGGEIGIRRRGAWTCWGSWIWVKMSQDGKGRVGMGYHGRRSTERILMLEKGRPRLRNLGQRDVLFAPPVSSRDVGREPYPAEKPVQVLRALVEACTDEGDLVVDPYAGSGSTGEAALLEGRRFEGADVDEEAVRLARGRLAAVCDTLQACPPGSSL